MSAVAERPNTVPATNEGGAIVSMIERLVSDPNIDVGKLEKMLDMQERILNRNAEMAFNESMTEAQSKMKSVAADCENKQTRSVYASYAALDRALRPIYTEHGFAMSFDTADGPADYVRVVCHVSHRAGHSRKYHVDMPADGKGAKGGDVMTKTHAVGAGMSYGMRYLLKMIFNVAVGEDDVDGNHAVPVISEQQAADLRALITEVGADEVKFLDYIKAESIESIPALSYEGCVKLIEAKRKAKK